MWVSITLACFILEQPSILLLNIFIPSNAKAQEHKDFQKPSKPCHASIHWIALAESSQMSAHVPGFQPLKKITSFCIGQINHQ